MMVIGVIKGQCCRLSPIHSTSTTLADGPSTSSTTLVTMFHPLPLLVQAEPGVELVAIEEEVTLERQAKSLMFGFGNWTNLLLSVD